MKIGFIGAGRMARALAQGILRRGLVRADDLICSSRTEESGRAFRALGVNGAPRWTADNVEVARASDVLVLAIKPQQFAAVLPPLREAGADKLFLSLAAGLTLAQLAAWLPPTARVVRAMPNMPLQVGLGASVYALGPTATAEDAALVDGLLGAAGRAWPVEEKQIDTIMALSGCGPAYVFHFMDALTRGAVALGLDEKLARELTQQTLLGAATLAAESPLAPLELAAQVKSPRGTTLAGCAVLEEGDALDHLMARCLAAALARAEALARGED